MIKNVCICLTQTDKTIEKYAIGEEVIEDLIQKINNSRLFDDDNRKLKKFIDFVLRIWIETIWPTIHNEGNERYVNCNHL